MAAAGTTRRILAHRSRHQAQPRTSLACGEAKPLTIAPGTKETSLSLIVFDLDGTLVDSARDLADTTNDVLALYGSGRLEQSAVAQMVGEGARKLVERALAAAGCAAPLDEALARFHEIYASRLVRHTRPYEGMADIVAEAFTRSRLAVLTNKPIEPTKRILETFDLSRYFAWVIGGDSQFPRKPDPASLAHLIGQAGVQAPHTLLIGDSAVDAETARRAGTRFCLARYGFGQARGTTTLREDEFSAETARDLTLVIDLFLAAA
jgi:phosphoglycolate phosphatase